MPPCMAPESPSGIKVFGRIAKDIPFDDLKVGMELRTKANTLGGGQLNYVFDKP